MGKEIKGYSPAEERANVLTHLAGGALFLFGIVPLWKLYAGDDLALRIGVVVYYLTILAMFGSSVSYHCAKQQEHRIFLRKCDHAAIYFLIAGTYTPIFLGPLKSGFGIFLLSLLWTLACCGTLVKFFVSQRYHWIDVLLYIIMGWCALIVFKPLCRNFPADGLAFLIGGGVVYTAGVSLYAWKAPFAHTWWHVVVFAGALLHYLAILSLRW